MINAMDQSEIPPSDRKHQARERAARIREFCERIRTQNYYEELLIRLINEAIIRRAIKRSSQLIAAKIINPNIRIEPVAKVVFGNRIFDIYAKREGSPNA